MESVAAHAFRMEARGNRVMVCDCVVRAVEAGIEAGDLRKVRKAGKKRTDGSEIVWLVQGRQRNTALKLGEHFAVDQYRPVVLRAAVHDTMPHGRRFDVL